MDRFVAIIWEDANEESAKNADHWSAKLLRLSPKWVNVIDRRGLRVFSYVHRSQRPIVTDWDDGVGIVVGVLFKRHQEQAGRVRHLGRAVTGQIIRTNGVYLSEHFWGNYVAIWENETTNAKMLARDPCGGVPCFFTTQQRVTLAFAHAEDVTELAPLRFTPDKKYLRAFAQFPYLTCRHTALKEVTECLPGENWTFQSARPIKRQWMWLGASYCKRGPSNQKFAATVLRDSINAAATAWATEYSSPLLCLSGGLDSSILSALLRQCASGPLTALHIADPTTSGEIKHAKITANLTGIDLNVAMKRIQNDQLAPLLRSNRLVKPKIQILASQADTLVLETAKASGADSIMMGQGGDNIFLQTGAAKNTLPDFVLHNGLKIDALQVAYHSATLQKRSVLEVFAGGAATLLRRRSALEIIDSPEWRARSALLRPVQTSDLAPYLIHPWVCDTLSQLSPGKQEHLFSTAMVHNYHTVHGPALIYDFIYPYMSQPVVECALSIPTYALTSAGVDRSLLRRAFADVVAPSVLRRTAKTTTNAYGLAVFRRNLSQYRELLLGGELRSHDWIDWPRLEVALTCASVSKGRHIQEVKQLGAVAIWLHTWRDQRVV